MKNETRLTPREHTDAVAESHTRNETGGHVFREPEEALRADRAATPVPPDVARRIASSIGTETPAARGPWWKRLFGN